jgi:thiamine-phosphate pyrophosphorylase
MTPRAGFPALYPILDVALLRAAAGDLAAELAEAGVELIQYRNKKVAAGELYRICWDMSKQLAGTGTRFIVNDRPDVAALCEAGGVHVGQEDLTAGLARRICPVPAWVGVSTHDEGQFREAAKTSADYIAVGPVFATKTKQRPDAEVGTGFISRMRGLTEKPIVAIGGITIENAESVFRAGADCIAVARDLLAADHPGRRAGEFLHLAGRVRAGNSAGT